MSEATDEVCSVRQGDVQPRSPRSRAASRPEVRKAGRAAGAEQAGAISADHGRPSGDAAAPASEPGADAVVADRVRAELLMPLHIISELNWRGHWAAKAKRVKHHRKTALTLLRAAYGKPSWQGPLVITLTRIAPRDLDEGDNLNSGLKACRDGIADWLGVNDGDKAITWNYTQERGKPKQYAARVVIEWSKA